ncbi:MAG: AraC family transcriptional regulator [Cyclobacteriaceae bacterium]
MDALLTVPLVRTNHSPIGPLKNDGYTITWSNINPISTQGQKSITIRYVASGREKVRIENCYYPLAANQYLIINPKVVVNIANDNSSSQGVWVQVKFPDTSDLSFFPGPYIASKSELGTLLSFIYSCRDNFPLDENLLAQQVIDSTLKKERIVQKRVNSIKASKYSTKSEIFKRLILAENYIELNLKRKITLPELCEVAGLSRFHFVRKFHEAYGASPHQFILRKKIYLAHNLIMNERKTISEIAHLCGFGDIHIFSKVFRKIQGYPPSMLRTVRAWKNS